MDDREQTTPELLRWRIERLEAEHVALRTEIQLRLHDEYLTANEMRVLFPTRKELAERATIRREWPVMLTSLVLAGTSIANLIVLIGGHH